MSNLPLFDNPKNIATHFNPNADIVMFNGETGDLLDTIPDNCVKLIITSPPYNIGKSYETQVSIDEYLDTQTKIISKFYRILHSGGSVCWQVEILFKMEKYFHSIFFTIAFSKN